MVYTELFFQSTCMSPPSPTLNAPRCSPLQSCRNNDNHFQTIQGLVIIGNLFLDQMNVPVKKIDILSIP